MAAAADAVAIEIVLTYKNVLEWVLFRVAHWKGGCLGHSQSLYYSTHSWLTDLSRRMLTDEFCKHITIDSYTRYQTKVY